MADITNEPGSQQGENWNHNVEYLRGLAQIVRDAGLSGLEIETDNWKIALRGPRPRFAVAGETAPLATSTFAPVSMGFAPLASPAATPATEEFLVPVVSPMVGVWYRAPSPSDPNFVEVGDRVEAGQTIGLVEAMKVFNEIAAESSGFVAQIPAQTGELVETGQPILLLRP